MDMLTVDLLQAKHVGAQSLQLGSQYFRARLEWQRGLGRQVKVFKVEGRNPHGFTRSTIGAPALERGRPIA